MALWKRWSPRRRSLTLATILTLLTLATTWAAASRNNAQELSAPLPSPLAVSIQKTGAFPDHGNLLIFVKLNSKQLEAKVADGTRSFVTLGGGDQTILLRDDGQGGDRTSGDGIFTGLGTADDEVFASRAEDDAGQVERNGSRTVPIFSGRITLGTREPQSFDFEKFQRGEEVSLRPAVAFVGAESVKGKASGGGLQTATAKLQNIRAAVTLGTNQFQERVLMIRDLAVVNDPTRTWDPCLGGNPNGAWTFNHLMTEMANQTASGIDPAIFVENWLGHWLVNQTINGNVVPNRNANMTALLAAWPKRLDGHIDLAQSPFRLLAIDPRLDLRRTLGGGGGYSNPTGKFLDAGEARFVFGHTNRCSPQPFAVIFEYRIPSCECEEVKDWAAKWVELDGFVPGTSDYNDRLAKLTESFVLAGSSPLRPNGSAIGQVRTNEISLGRPWELREFQLTQFPFSFLAETTAADTPIDAFNIPAPTAAFDNWVTTVAGFLTPGLNFEDPIPGVPLFFNGANFLGSNPRTPSTGFHWRVTPALVPSLSPSAGMNTINWGRHRASMASCNGCHGRESRPALTVARFVHVDPSTAFGFPATLSEFLTGVNNLPDPQEPAGLPLRSFDDLARREIDIQEVAKTICVKMKPVDEDVKAFFVKNGSLPADIFGSKKSAAPPVPIAVDDFLRNVILEVH